MEHGSLLTLFARFAREAREGGIARDVAVVQRRGYRREMWTYAEIAAMAEESARVLRDGDVQPGERVLLWGANSAEWMAAFWGCLIRGAVAVPMDAGATPEFAARVMRDAGVKFAFADARHTVDVPARRLEDLADSARERRRTISEGEKGPIGAAKATRDTVAEILFTSGTTGEPRGVVLTHGNFLANLEPVEKGIGEYRKYERWIHPLRFVTMVPLSHVFGQFMALLVPPLLGATVVLEDSANPAEVLRAVKRERATALIAVPRMLEAVQAGLERSLEARGETDWFRRNYAAANGEKFLRRVWRFRRIHRRLGWKFWAFISGGAALSAGTEEFLRRIGYAVVQGYGMTETASLISLNHPFRAAEGSIGKVLPGREFKLAEDGEILVRGENVAAGYWEGGRLREAGEEGWLYTGDIGELDSEGNLRFRGRKKNVIVTAAGLNVYPEDLEAALKRQPGVRDAVVLAEDRGGNAEPAAVLLLSDGNETAARRAIEGANAELAEYQRIRDWSVWPAADFPRTATGKPRLAEIRARRALDRREGRVAGEARELGAGMAPAGIAALIEKIVGEPAPSGELEKELNLSSLDRLELLSALEEKFRVELNETAFARAKSLGDIQKMVRQPPAERTEYVYPAWAQREAVRWLRLLVYYALVWPATQILGHPRTIGRENLRGVRGPVVIVSNHITRRADIGLILAALPARFRNRLATAMGGESLEEMRTPVREWWFAKRWTWRAGYWLLTALFNVFPLPKFSGFRESFRFAGESLGRGYSVLIFPEGEVNNTETGEMAPFQPGIGLLARNLEGVPVVPMRLDGVWRMKRERRRFAHRGEITVRIGKPVTFGDGMAAERIASCLETKVREL